MVDSGGGRAARATLGKQRPARRRSTQESEFGSWSVEGQALTITYDWGVLDEINAYVIDGFHRLSRGGLEVGGVLYGVTRGDSIEVRAWLPIDCEHARGPAFLLSKNDQAALTRLFEEASKDRALAGFEPVGWFLSHTRSELKLTSEDLEIYDEYFPESWQVALVLKPDAFKPTRAGFFFREPDETIQIASSYKEFSIDPTRPRPVAAPLPGPVKPIDAVRELPAKPAVVSQPEPPPATAMPEPQRIWNEFIAPLSSTRKWLGLAAAVVVVVSLSLCIVHLMRTEENPAFALQLTESNGLLRIVWDKSADVLRTAELVQLEIVDGTAKIERLIAQDELSTASIVYQRRTGDVAVRVVVHRRGGKRVEEIARYIGQPVDQHAR